MGNEKESRIVPYYPLVPSSRKENKEEIKKIIHELSQLDDLEFELADVELKTGNYRLFEEKWENIKKQLSDEINNKNTSYISEISPFIEKIEEYIQEEQEICSMFKKYIEKASDLDTQMYQMLNKWLIDMSDQYLYDKLISVTNKANEEYRKCEECFDKVDGLRKKCGQTIFELKEKLCKIYEIAEN